MKNLFSIGWADAGKGFLIAALTVILGGLLTALQATPPHFPTLSDLGSLATAGIAAGIAYLVKNFFTNSQNQLMKAEPNK